MQALRTFIILKTGLDGQRVIVGGLKEGTISSKQLFPAIALRRSGGIGRYGERDNLQLVAQRFDATCFAETRLEAMDALAKLAGALKDMARDMVDNVLLHRVNKSGSAFDLVDEETNLPISVQSFELVAEI